MRAVFLDMATVDCGDLDQGPLYQATPEWTFYPDTAPEERSFRIKDAEIVVVNKTVLDAATLAAAPRLQLICTAATGTNNVATAVAAARGIPVCNARDYATDSVVQHVFAMLLMLATRIEDYRNDVRAGLWQKSARFCLLDYPIQTISDLHLGIVGFGVLGQATATVARAFGMRVSVASSLQPDGQCQPSRLPLDELLRQVDVLSLHCPLTPQTVGLINAERIGRMRRGSWIINTARGAIVNPVALADALRTGHLGGAGIDVLDVEPPPAGHPLLASDIPNLILTPHTAWAARSARQNVLIEIRDNILAFRAGQPRNRVLP